MSKDIDRLAIKVETKQSKSAKDQPPTKDMQAFATIDRQPCGLLVSLNKSKLTEQDLLMMCVDNPYYLSRALGHDNTEGTGLTTMD